MASRALLVPKLQIGGVSESSTGNFIILFMKVEKDLLNEIMFSVEQ